MTGCPTCGERMNHGGDPLTLAACAYRHAATDRVRDVAIGVGADPVAAVDLLAHVRGLTGEGEALRLVRYVLDLGWRPCVGIHREAS